MTSRNIHASFRARPWLVAVLTCVTLVACRRSAPPEKNGSMSSSAEIAPVVGADGSNDAMAPLALPSSAPQDDPPYARDMRERLVRQIETFDRPWGSDGGWDARVLEAMRKVPRH